MKSDDATTKAWARALKLDEQVVVPGWSDRSPDTMTDLYSLLPFFSPPLLVRPMPKENLCIIDLFADSARVAPSKYKVLSRYMPIVVERISAYSFAGVMTESTSYQLLNLSPSQPIIAAYFRTHPKAARRLLETIAGSHILRSREVDWEHVRPSRFVQSARVSRLG